MSAPSSSHGPRPSTLLLVLVAAVVAAGCTVPGSSRLQGPPEDLPPSLHYVTADALGFTLYDTDPDSTSWDGLGSRRAEATLEALHGPVFGDDADVAPWIGETAGIALRELDLDGTAATSTLYFADVRRVRRLEAFLDTGGWRGSAEPRTVEGFTFDLYQRDEGDYRAAAVFDDAIVAARSDDALVTLLDAADRYAVPDRKAMREYAVEARDRVPASFLFRGDLWRTQVRRPFQDDPAMLELARWATDSNTLVALRDGWVGIAPPLDRDATDRVRLVGASEWVPDLAPDIELQPVDRELLDELHEDVDQVFALHDPGQQLRELVRAITIGAGQYVTGEDVPDEDDRVELLPVLDELDGDAAIGLHRDAIIGQVRVDDPQGVAEGLRDVIDHAELPASIGVTDDAVNVTVIRAKRLARLAVGDLAPRRTRDLAAAGAPPRPPVLWVWSKGGACVGPTAGWVTFDGTDELRMSVAVQLREGSSCGGELLARTGASIGLPLRKQSWSSYRLLPNSDG